MQSPNESNLNTLELKEDENGDLVLEFPDELLDSMGWGEGTELEIDVFAGRLVLRETAKGK